MINLLPTDVSRRRQTNKVSIGLKFVAIVVSFLVVLVSVASVAYVLYLRSDLSKKGEAIATLKSEAMALEDTEKQILFLKDRLEKIRTFESQNASANAFVNQKKLVDLFASDSASVGEARIDPGSSTIAFVSKDLNIFDAFISEVKNTNLIENLVMQSLTFNPFVGYKLSMELPFN